MVFSIIYNNFDQKKYPRLVGKSKPGKVLNSKTAKLAATLMAVVVLPTPPF